MKERFVDVKALEERIRQRDELNKIIYGTPDHCRQCGDTKPKHGFYPLWGKTIGEGHYMTSGYLCNKCALTDEVYEETFGEPKSNDIPKKQ